MKQTLLLFGSGVLLCGAILTGLSYLRADQAGAICAATAVAICALPAGLSMVLALWCANRSPSEQMMAVFGGMAFRLVMTLGLGVAVFLLVPFFRSDKQLEYVYWGNILISYLFTLGLETVLLVRGRRSDQDSRGVSEVRN